MSKCQAPSPLIRRKNINSIKEFIKSRRTFIILSCLFLLGLFLRIHRISIKSIWLDEAFSIWVARFDLKRCLDWIIRIDQHPPFYYILLNFWMRLFGTAPAAVRGLSVLFGLLALPFFYGACKRFLGNRTALIALFLLVISPFHIQYSQETRMYSLLVLSTAAGLYFLACLLMPDEGKRSGKGSAFFIWAGYAVSQTCVMLTHNIGLIFFPLIINTVVLGSLVLRRAGTSKSLFPGLEQKGFLGKWLIGQGFSLLLWLPWLGPFIRQTLRVRGDFWLSFPTWESIYYTFQNFNFAFLPREIPLPAAWNIFYWGLAFLGILALRKKIGTLLLFLLLFLGPMLGEWLASFFRPVFLDRTLIAGTLTYYMLLAAGMNSLTRPGLLFKSKKAGSRIILSVILILVLIPATGSFVVFYVFHQNEGWSGAAEHVAKKIKPDDIIIFNATWTQIPFDYYYHAYKKKNQEKGLPVDLFDRNVLEPKMALTDIPYMISLLRDKERICLVYSHDWFTDPDQIIIRTLDHAMIMKERKRFPGIGVFWFEPRPGGWDKGRIMDWLKKRAYTFRYQDAKAREVSVAGTFNLWYPRQEHRMKKDERGIWSLSLDIPRGRNEYLFVVDNREWKPDPRNPDKVPNGWGFSNSVIIMK
ncbi:MAG: glycosyltransferase family 39 protein [bacterium]|nr:glycosyltransferase family 39 protein [bacterium]